MKSKIRVYTMFGKHYNGGVACNTMEEVVFNVTEFFSIHEDAIRSGAVKIVIEQA